MKIILSQKGTIQLPMLMLTLALMTVAIFFQVKAKERYLEIKQISNHYLCLKEGVRNLKRLTEDVAKSNRAIQALFYSKNLTAPGLPQVSAKANSVTQALKAYQSFLYVSFVKKNLTLSHCRLDQSIQFLLLIPYQHRHWQIDSGHRHFDGTLKLKKTEKWNFYFTNQKLISAKGLSFITKLELSIKDRFSVLSYHGCPKNHLLSQEWLSLKPFSGSSP